MSETSPNPSWGAFDRRPSLPPSYWGAQADALHHHMLLERCFDGREARWSDALIARTRRHVGGCVSAVEMGLRMALDPIAVSELSLADAVPQDYCWRAVQHKPAILSASLLRHFRDRAALSLMGQEAADIPPSMAEIEQDQDFPSDAAQSLASLSFILAGWRDTSPDHIAMRPDLPAEMMQDLVWTCAALMTQALVRTDLVPVQEAVALVQRAGHAVLERYDEQHSPFALAPLFALQMRAVPAEEERLLTLARGQHVMALLAIAAERNGIEIKHVISSVVEGVERDIFTLCRAADFPREVAVRLVLGRRIVSRGVKDKVLVDYADQYEAKSCEEARGAVLNLSLDEIFRDRLNELGRWESRHDG